jgi:acyl carrier protein
MEDKVLEIINIIRSSKNLNTLNSIHLNNNLRNDIEFTSFDLAELTVRIEDEFGVDIFEDGLINTIGEIYQKLQ